MTLISKLDKISIEIIISNVQIVIDNKMKMDMKKKYKSLYPVMYPINTSDQIVTCLGRIVT